MKIDLTNLVTNLSSSININEKVEINEELLKTSNLEKLDNVIFNGKIYKDYENNLILEGKISGTMILVDDLSLENVSYPFDGEIYENIEEIFKIEKNTIDILDYLWQNILVEVPMRVRSKNSENIHLEGDGWRLIKEEDLEKNNNHPFSDLSKLLNSKGGK